RTLALEYFKSLPRLPTALLLLSFRILIDVFPGEVDQHGLTEPGFDLVQPRLDGVPSSRDGRPRCLDKGGRGPMPAHAQCNRPEPRRMAGRIEPLVWDRVHRRRGGERLRPVFLEGRVSVLPEVPGLAGRVKVRQAGGRGRQQLLRRLVGIAGRVENLLPDPTQ